MRYILLLHTCLLLAAGTSAQIVINEGSNRNGTLFTDEDGDYEDWIELYNTTALPLYLEGYAITDDPSQPFKWTLPDLLVEAHDHVLLLASGKDRKPLSAHDHWEQPVSETAVWKFLVPNLLTPTTWKSEGFDDGAWPSGNASIGYGDGDDLTPVPDGTLSVYLRHTFFVEDTSLLGDAIFSIDFDDGFVAYLNGHVIGMYGFAAPDPAYNALSGLDHESAMYAGGAPENFYILEDSLKAWIQEGENVLAVEVHNVDPGSSDLTALPFFSIGIKTEPVIWTDVLPAWFTTTPAFTFLHTNFKIDGAGETIYLTDPSGVFIDSMFVLVEEADHSKGRETDGAVTRVIFTSPTPDAPNSGPTYTGYTTGMATITPPAGFYTDPVSVDITIPAGCIGRYTLNGEIPTLLSPICAGAIEIDENTVVRVRLFDAAGELLPGDIFTNTYFLNEEISLPVISLSTNEDNLYGAEGIFDNWWTDWKKLCYIEYFDSTGIQQFEQACGFKVDGGAGGSRGHAQKSMRIEPDNSAFGDGVLEYPLIPRRWYVQEYETFYLRNGSNMHNTLPYKDAYMVRITEGTYNEHMAYTPVVVFINGEYWGFYELRNKLDEGHFDRAHGIEKDSLDLLTLSYWYGLVLRTLSGSADDFIAMRQTLGAYPTPADTEFYALADSLLDLNNFTDYIIAETWMGNYDWPYNNIKAWRDRGGDNKWKYAVIDLELGMGIEGWSDPNSNLISGLFYTQEYIEPLARLLQNPDYREYFINRYADLMNSTLLSTRIFPMEDSLYNEIYPEMPRQLERWGAGPVAVQMNTFENYREALLDDFAIRSSKVRQHIRTGFELEKTVWVTLEVNPPEAGYIKISTLYIEDMPWSGYYFDGNPVQIEAFPNTGYTFDHWEENIFIDDVLDPMFKENITANTTFTAWFSGAPVPEEISVTEINYNPEASVNAGEWIEITNFSEAPVDLSRWMIRDNDPLHTYTIPEGTILSSDERLIVAGDTMLFASMHPAVSTVVGPLGFGLSDSADAIQVFDRHGVERQLIHYSGVSPWPQGADGHGRTLELQDPEADMSDPENWFDGCIGGSPGTPYTPCYTPVVFSEINYNADDDADCGDWVELRNISDEPVDVSGWKFMHASADSTSYHQLAPGTVLAPHTNYVLAQDGELFTAIFPTISADTSFDFPLDNGGDWLRMYDADGILQMSVDYDDMYPWPTVADGAGYTLELVDSLGKMNEGTNWVSVCYGGSPAAYYALPCIDPVTVSTPLTQEGLRVYPNPADGVVNIYFEIQSDADISFQLATSAGNILYNYHNFHATAGVNTMTLPLEKVPAGIYTISIIFPEGKSTVSFVRL